MLKLYWIQPSSAPTVMVCLPLSHCTLSTSVKELEMPKPAVVPAQLVGASVPAKVVMGNACCACPAGSPVMPSALAA